MVMPYYDEGGVTIYHGDCAEVMASVEADAVVTDPPYGVGVRYKSGFDDGRDDYWPWMRERVEQMRAVSALVVFTHRVAALRELTGWDWVGVWNKPWSSGSRVGNSCVLPHWEPVFLYGIHGLGTKSAYCSDVFTCDPVPAPGLRERGREAWASVDNEGHPTPKPLSLYRSLIAGPAQHADTILDPFMGSGTTLRAAKDLGKRAIGIELSERWCETAAPKLAQEVLNFGVA